MYAVIEHRPSLADNLGLGLISNWQVRSSYNNIVASLSLPPAQTKMAAMRGTRLLQHCKVVCHMSPKHCDVSKANYSIFLSHTRNLQQPQNERAPRHTSKGTIDLNTRSKAMILLALYKSTFDFS